MANEKEKGRRLNDFLERIPGVEQGWGYWVIVGLAIVMALLALALVLGNIKWRLA